MQSFPKPMTAQEELECISRYRAGDIEAKNLLIEKNLRLVAHIVKKYTVSGRDQEELISVGIVGLVKAVNTFDADKGHKLVTYAARCIENAILSQMRVWFQISTPRAEKNQNGVFCHRFPIIFTSFVPLQTAM